MFGLIIGFFRYYTVSQPLRLPSVYSCEETKRRLDSLNAHRDVRVKINRKGEVTMVATAHAGGRGTPIIPEAKATIRDKGGLAVLEGEVGLHQGTRTFAWSFLAILVGCEFMPGSKEAFPGALLYVIAFCLLLFIAAYAYGRRDTALILRRLDEALGVRSNV